MALIHARAVIMPQQCVADVRYTRARAPRAIFKQSKEPTLHTAQLFLVMNEAVWQQREEFGRAQRGNVAQRGAKQRNSETPFTAATLSLIHI